MRALDKYDAYGVRTSQVNQISAEIVDLKNQFYVLFGLSVVVLLFAGFVLGRSRR